MHTTSRLGIQVPDGSDNESAYPAVASQAAGILDNAAIYNEGTLAGRPAAGTVAHGTFYRSTDINDLSYSNGTLWINVASGLVYTPVTANTNAATGQFLISTAGGGPFTVTLPTSPPTGAIVAVMAQAAPLTVVAPVTITGVGLSSTVFSLGTTSAAATLLYDGSAWRMIAGQQDSGWVGLTLATNVTAGTYTPSARLQGDTVRLKGTMQNQTGGTINSGISWATIPTGLRPSAQVNLTGYAQSLGLCFVTISTGGAVSAGVSIGNNFTLSLDGISYSLS